MKNREIALTDAENVDLDLFQQITGGSYDAMENLFKKYYSKLCRFGSLYEEDSGIVEEKVADVFIYLWKNRQNLDKISNPKSYIYVIVRNSLQNRKKSRQPHQSLENIKPDRDLFLPSVEDELIDREQKERTTNLIREILHDIPRKSRQVFELSRIDGLRYKEISEKLKISPKTVENHIAIAMKYIRKALQEYKERC